MSDPLPGGWKLVKITDCMEAIIDYRGKTPQKTSVGVPLITARIVKGGRILDIEEYIAPEDYDAWMRRGLPKPGDVVITTEAPLGEVAQLDGRKVALAQRLITLRGKSDRLDNTFLKFLLQSEFVRGQIQGRGSGTTVIGIRQSELREVHLPIPPLNEQRVIAHILGSLDDKIALNRRTNRTLAELAAALFKSWFVDFDPVVAKMEGRQPFGMDAETAALFPAAFEESEIGLAPAGWRVGSILELADLLSGGTPSTSVASYWNGDVPWVSAKDVSNANGLFVLETERTISAEGVERSATKLLRKLTTVVTARGTVGSYCLLGGEMAMNQTNYGLRSKDGISHYFVFFALAQMVEQLKQHAYGTIFDTITTKAFQDLKVILPAHATIQRFERRVSPLMELILMNLQQSRTLAAIRDALLPKLMAGEIRVG